MPGACHWHKVVCAHAPLPHLAKRHVARITAGDLVAICIRRHARAAQHIAMQPQHVDVAAHGDALAGEGVVVRTNMARHLYPNRPINTAKENMPTAIPVTNP